MCVNRGNFKASVVLVLLTMALCSGVVVSGGCGCGEPASRADKVDVGAYTGMCRLRKAIHLSDETLAAAGCSEADATRALGALLAWYNSNAAAIEANGKADVKAANDLRLALRKVGMGPRNETLLATVPTLRAARTAAIKGRNDLVNAAVAAAESQLSASQKKSWTTVRNNLALRTKYRHAPDLTGEQRKALHVANRSHARRMASARTVAGRAAVTAQFATTENRILSAAQKTAMATAQTNIVAKKGDAAKAAQAVMPIPAELKQEPKLDPNDPRAIIKKRM